MYRTATATTRRSGAFRDTLIVSGLAVAGVVGLVVWSGGDGSVGGASTTQPDPVVDGQADATAQAPAPGVAEAQLALPSDPAASEAMVTVRDAFIAALPAPAGGTEQPPNGAGVRTWLLPGTDWESALDAYIAVLQPLGFVATPYQSIDESGAVGELLVLSDPTGTVHVQLAAATQGGQSVIEVTRQ